MNRTANPPPGVGIAWGLALAVLLIAVATAVAAFWAHHAVITTPDGPAVVVVEEGR